MEPNDPVQKDTPSLEELRQEGVRQARAKEQVGLALTMGVLVMGVLFSVWIVMKNPTGDPKSPNNPVPNNPVPSSPTTPGR
jgi:cell division protein FtsN